MWCLGDSLGQSFSSSEQCLGVEVLLVRRCILGNRRRSDFSEHQGDDESVLSLLHMLQGLQRESKDWEKDHYKNKTRKPNKVPKKKSEKTPYELWKGMKPSYKYLRVWGCLAKVAVPPPKKVRI